MAIGCRSVGNPGNGSVATLTALGRSYWTTRKPSSVCVTVAPASCSLCSTNCRWCRVDASDRDVPARHRRGDPPCRGDDAVADHPVLGGIQPVDAGDRHRRRASARDLGAHLIEHRAQVDDVGFARGIVDRRDALGHHRGHQDVLGRPDRRELELNLCAAQVICLGDHTAVLDVARAPSCRRPA